jgi:hypothetical protein
MLSAFRSFPFTLHDVYDYIRNNVRCSKRGYHSMDVCSLIAREGINRFEPNLVRLFVETGGGVITPEVS